MEAGGTALTLLRSRNGLQHHRNEGRPPDSLMLAGASSLKAIEEGTQTMMRRNVIVPLPLLKTRTDVSQVQKLDVSLAHEGMGKDNREPT